MPIDNYKPNSRASKIGSVREEKEEVKKEKVEKIVQGVVKKKKKNFLTNIFGAIDFGNITEYIIQDVIIPTLKDGLEDTVSMMIRGLEDTVSMMIRGGEPRRNNSRRSTSSRVSYRSYYEREDRERDRDRDRGNSRTRGYAYDEITLKTRGEALDVITRLEEIVDMYGNASVADLYDLVGISGQHTDNKYGWTDVRSADTVRVRDGYLLKMPRAIPLN